MTVNFDVFVSVRLYSGSNFEQISLSCNRY